MKGNVTAHALFTAGSHKRDKQKKEGGENHQKVTLQYHSAMTHTLENYIRPTQNKHISCHRRQHEGVNRKNNRDRFRT